MWVGTRVVMEGVYGHSQDGAGELRQHPHDVTEAYCTLPGIVMAGKGLLLGHSAASPVLLRPGWVWDASSHCGLFQLSLGYSWGRCPAMVAMMVAAA